MNTPSATTSQTLATQTPATDTPAARHSQKAKTFKSQRKQVFQPRTSRLDVETVLRPTSEFRGFFVLFWIAIAFYIVSTLLLNWRQQGQMLRWALVDVMSHDLLVFAVSDLLMIGFTFTVVPLVWAVTGRWIPIFLGRVLKHLLQATLILGGVWWTLQRDWPWPQSATFCMHCVAMYMKMHSYATTNMEYEVARRRVYKLQKKLADDASRRSSATAVTATAVDDSSTPPSIRRRRSMRKASIESLEVSQMTPATAGVELEDLEKELRKGSTVYPSNQTVGNFFDFLAIPTFVYELEYPRTERIRPLYVLEKVAALVGTIGILYFLVENFVVPHVMNVHDHTVAETIVHLLLPFMLGWILIFTVIFECVANAFAELTRFADRDFYEDWWNSLTFDEFARKWNHPVHEFLLRHIYSEAIDSYKLSKTSATFFTFLFSAILHELVVAVVSRRIVFVFFVSQMMQLPLIWAAKVFKIKRYPLLANVVFWVSLVSGMPLITILYTRDYYLRNPLSA